MQQLGFPAGEAGRTQGLWDGLGFMGSNHVLERTQVGNKRNAGSRVKAEDELQQLRKVHRGSGVRE